MGPSEGQRLNSVTVALALLSGVTVLVTSAWAGWLFGWGLHGWSSVMATALVVTGLLRACGSTWRAAVQAALLALLVAALLALVSGRIHDLSDDGQQYHQQAVMELSQGWNPLRDPSSPVRNHDALWVDGYAKTHWVYAALLQRLGAGIEAGKSFSWLLAIAALLLVRSLLVERLGWRPRPATFVAAVAVLNPVLACQWPTLLNDQTLASLILLALAGLAWAAGGYANPHDRRRAGALIVCVFALLATVKASGLAYGGLLLMLTLPMLLWGHGLRVTLRLGGLAAAGLTAGVLVLGFNPYVTNTIQHGHPFYPLAGEGKVDIISYNAPPGLLELSRPQKLLGSLAARSSSVIGSAYSGPSLLTPKLPGSISAAELKPFLTKSVIHLGGFGPWFSLALLLALLGMCWAWMRRRRTAWQRGLLVLPTVLLLLSALAFPEPWWARYVPQLWFIPVVVAVAMITLGHWEVDAMLRRMGWSVLAVTTLNAALVALLFIAGNLPRHLDMATQFDSLRELSRAQSLRMDISMAPATALRLDEAHIRWVEAPDEQACDGTAAWVTVEYTYARVCLDDAQRARFRVNSPLIEKLKSLR